MRDDIFNQSNWFKSIINEMCKVESEQTQTTQDKHNDDGAKNQQQLVKCNLSWNEYKKNCKEKMLIQIAV